MLGIRKIILQRLQRRLSSWLIASHRLLKLTMILDEVRQEMGSAWKRLHGDAVAATRSDSFRVDQLMPIHSIEILLKTDSGLHLLEGSNRYVLVHLTVHRQSGLRAALLKVLLLLRRRSLPLWRELGALSLVLVVLAAFPFSLFLCLLRKRRLLPIT